MPSGYTLIASHVVHETIDGETILIHLRTGTYYSLEGSGSEVWQLVVAGATRAQLLEAATRRYDGEPREIELGLLGLLDELVREEILVEADVPEAAAAPALPDGRVPFSVPVLQSFTDMQEFMLVDPLHEVDEVAGWPHVGAA
jgi:hypothetical protein